MLAHGLEPPRRRGFAGVGDQRCTEYATTISHDEFARKSEGADFSRNAACKTQLPARQSPTSLALRANSFAHLYSR